MIYFLVSNLAQEVFLDFFEIYKGSELSEKHVKILFGYCKNYLKRFYASRKKDMGVEFLEQHNNTDLQAYFDNLRVSNDNNYQHRITIVLDLLPKLNPRVKAVIEYRFLYGMKRSDIAIILGISEKDVHTYQKRGIRYLQKALEEKAKNIGKLDSKL